MRKQIRLPHYDYTSPGQHFVTVCTHQRRHLFGEIHDGEMVPSSAGETITSAWRSLSTWFPGVQDGGFVLMPNHLHGLLVFSVRVPSGLGQVVRIFKSRTSRSIRSRRPGLRVWQRGYFEHVVRDEVDRLRVLEYMVNNPLTWASDRENEQQSGRDAFHDWLLDQKGRRAS